MNDKYGTQFKKGKCLFMYGANTDTRNSFIDWWPNEIIFEILKNVSNSLQENA